MPRTSAADCPGCPPLRALTTDVLGLVKVVEVRGNGGTPKVVETWGPPDASRGVVAASFADRQKDPGFAVARKSGLIEFLNPLSGESLATITVGETGSTGHASENDPIAGLHFFTIRRSDSSHMLGTLLTCTEKGKACLRSITKRDAPSDFQVDSPVTWSLCNGGSILCSSVDGNEKHALFGGKGVEVNLWDLANCSKMWTAKPPPSNSLGIFSPTWFTAVTFLSKDDHRKIVAGTKNHEIRLYDVSSKRRAVVTVNFGESPIKAVAADVDGYTIYMGTGSGDLASFDMRTGKLLGCYKGKCCGSIRSIARHPELPVLASCGLDSYLRLWDIRTRQLLSAVYLKQHLTNVVFDSHFSAEGASEGTKVEQKDHHQEIKQTDTEQTETDYDGDGLEFEMKSGSKKRRQAEENRREKKKSIVQDEDQVSGVVDPEDSNKQITSKRRKSVEQGTEKKKPKKSKKKT